MSPLCLDDLALDGQVLLARVAFAVRDEHWATRRIPLAPVGPGEMRGTDTDLGAHLRCTVRADGNRLEIAYELSVERELAVSRAGPYVLHADPFRGLLHSDGVPELLAVPVDVVPSPPVSGYSRLAYDVAGHRLDLAFAGDRFEMEDQRNWGDACFKSYCPPLTAQRPVVVRSGQPRTHRITLTATPADGRVRLPALGTRHEGRLDATARVRLRGLGLDFLHLQADLCVPGWERRLADDLDACRQLGVRAVVTAVLPPECRDDLPALGAADEVLVFDAGSPRTSGELAAAARDALPHVVLGGGSRGFLAGLNRDGGAPAELDVVAFPVAGATHEEDRHAVAAGLRSLSAMTRAGHRLAGGRPLFVGPLTLRPVFDAWRSEGGPWVGADLWAGTDFAAEWLRCAVVRLAAGGVARVSLATTAALTAPDPLAEILRRWAALPNRILHAAELVSELPGLLPAGATGRA